MLKMYFGHPINTYDTELEAKLLKIIEKEFPHWIIENPNQPHHDEGYKRRAKNTGNGMDYFYKEVLPDCDTGIFLPFRDGRWGAGVYGEAKALIDRGCPIFLITFEGDITYLKHAEFKKIKPLSIPETRARVRDENRKMIPY